MTDVVNFTEVYRFAPGYLMPVSEWRWPDPVWVLNAIGQEVDAELTWDWPAPYDGEQRRAKVRLREKIRRTEEYVAGLGVWATRLNANFRLYPWQEEIVDRLMNADRIVVRR